MTTSNEHTMKALVTSPDAVEWQGEIVAVESSNSEGPFSILPDHTRFITIISGQPVTFFLPDDSTKVFTYEKAVLVAEDNVVTIYVHVIDSP